MREIQLTKGKVALVDDEDYEYLNQLKWCATNHGHKSYAVHPKYKGKSTYMHRLIVKAGKGQFVDHKDGNTLNNQKGNLRLCTKAQNNCNTTTHRGSTSKYLGVCWYKAYSKWNAQIHKNGRTYKLGYFHSEIEAALAYNKKAIELHGEFANLNRL